VRHKLPRILPILLLILMPSWAAAQSGATGSAALQRSTGVLSGTVADGSGNALAGVKVKVFEEGFLLTEGESGADGGYRLEIPYVPDIDWTLMVWYVPPTGELIPEILILRESLRSKELELWSPCLPRLELTARMSFDAVLYDEPGKLKQMSELDCMEGTQ